MAEETEREKTPLIGEGHLQGVKKVHTVSRSQVITVVVGVVMVTGCAFLGYFLRESTKKSWSSGGGPVSVPQIEVSGRADKLVFQALDETSPSQKLLAEIKAEGIRPHLRYLSKNPHLAGTPADLQQARYLKNFWLGEARLDTVNIIPYDVFLSYPNPDNPNRIELQDGHGGILHTSSFGEDTLGPDPDHEDVVPPYNAYSASGSTVGELVYVNYGRLEDFAWICETEGLDLHGKICIAKYGKIYRGQKAQLAEQYGCSGLILFSDPADYARHGAGVYPDAEWLPGSGVQRGSVKQDINEIGDPLTPGYPSTESAYRISEDEADLPRIPVQPIGYDDAHVFLENMAGSAAPSDWQGALPITYNIGPGFVNSSWRVQMSISTRGEQRTTYDVIGFIEGAIEPDRFVLLGNHRDAWVLGAIDPSIGTASMMEISRAFGQLISQGWRPRRTIVFCSWGAEEQGLVGSREWVENFEHILDSRAVAYINGDSIVTGNFSLDVSASPMLHGVLFEAAKKVVNPSASERAAGYNTVYDTWLNKKPEVDVMGALTGKPSVGVLGSGSDHAPFTNKVGISSADLSYTFDPNLTPSSPLYHTAYDSFFNYETYVDPNFSVAVASSQVWADTVLQLADTPVIPYSTSAYPIALAQYVAQIDSTYGDLLRSRDLQNQLNFLQGAVERFYAAEQMFRSRLANHRLSPLQLRQMNDQMMALERTFIDPQGLPGRPLTRHVVFAPSERDSYSGSTLAGLRDSLFGIETIADEKEARHRWNLVAKQLSVITYFIQSAADLLAPPTRFMSDNDLV